MGFAQHQSFYLRDRWIEKFFSYYKSLDPETAKENFSNKNYLRLGLGKNMFESLKYWVRASQILSKDFKVTKVGEIISQKDIMLLNTNTLSIIHYLIVSNKEEASFWYWFFNIYPGKTFLKESITFEDSIYGWAKYNFKKISIKSLRKDLLCMVQMYTQKEDINDPEDTIFSPFYKLALIENNEYSIIKKDKKGSEIGYIALLYTLLNECEKNNLKTISVDQIYTNPGLWGKIFNLDKSAIIQSLSEIKNKYPDFITFDQTAKLDMVNIIDSNSLLFLEKNLGRSL